MHLEAFGAGGGEAGLALVPRVANVPLQFGRRVQGVEFRDWG